MSHPKRIVLCWSGGKDSCLALHRLIEQGFEVIGLLSMVSAKYGRNHAHGLPFQPLRLQAQALDIPITLIDSSSDYAHELKKALLQFKNQGADAVAFGSLYSHNDRQWNENLTRNTGLEPLFPVWISKSEVTPLYTEWVSLGYQSVICRASEKYFDQTYPGKILTLDLLDDFYHRGICPMGEYGEYHTFVTDGPLFHKSLNMVQSAVVLNAGLWSLDIQECVLSRKNKNPPKSQYLV